MVHRRKNHSDEEDWDEEDPWSEMSRERSPYESDDDYEDRQQDLNDWAESFND